MTIKELKKVLNKCPDNMQIALSSDSEGNSFSLLDNYSVSNIAYLCNSDVTSDDKALVLYPMR